MMRGQSQPINTSVWFPDHNGARWCDLQLVQDKGEILRDLGACPRSSRYGDQSCSRPTRSSKDGLINRPKVALVDLCVSADKVGVTLVGWIRHRKLWKRADSDPCYYVTLTLLQGVPWRVLSASCARRQKQQPGPLCCSAGRVAVHCTLRCEPTSALLARRRTNSLHPVI